MWLPVRAKLGLKWDRAGPVRCTGRVHGFLCAHKPLYISKALEDCKG